jgi:hypothetical protein
LKKNGKIKRALKKEMILKYIHNYGLTKVTLFYKEGLEIVLDLDLHPKKKKKEKLSHGKV